MSAPSVPSSRPIHSISEPAAGSLGTYDPAAQEAPAQKVLTAFDFGAFVVAGSGGADVLGPATTQNLLGVALVAQSSGDYANNAYLAADIAGIGRRGYYIAKIDPDNKPSVGGAIRVSFATDKKGWLTSSATSSLLIAQTSGIRIERVYDTVAEVYLNGNPVYPVASS